LQGRWKYSVVYWWCQSIIIAKCDQFDKSCSGYAQEGELQSYHIILRSSSRTWPKKCQSVYVEGQKLPYHVWLYISGGVIQQCTWHRAW
jgi:hypothetical protein